MFKNINNSGSTLIEVLVAILVVGLVVTGAMLSVAFSVKNSAEARYREAASQLAQDGMEVVKLRRDVEQWSEFVGRDAGIYCLNSTTSPDLPSSTVTNPVEQCGAITLENKTYVRYVTITPAVTQVNATVVVEWDSDDGEDRNVEISQNFRERAI